MERTKEYFMNIAIEEAKMALAGHEVPVGAAAVLDGECIAKAHNKVVRLCDPTAHAEMILLRKVSGLLNNYRLREIEIYVTLEPCPMCISAAIHSRVQAVNYGATSEKWGYQTRFTMDTSLWNHQIKVYSGIMEQETAALLTEFFRTKR